MGWLSDKLYGKRKRLDTTKINKMMEPTQSLVSEQLGLSRQLMDPESAINMQMRNLMAQRASETGAQVGMQMQRMGAMRGMSPAQAMMQARMAQTQAMGGVNQQWQQGLQNQFGQGLGLLGQMTSMQQGLNEGQVNAYVSQINAANARRNQREGTTMSLLGSIAGRGMV